jgi:hypothetical protein
MKLSQRATKILGAFIAIALLLALGLGSFLLVRAIWNAFASLPKETAVAILTGSATVLTATITVVIGRLFERKKELDAVHRNKKIPIYDDFIEGILLHFAYESPNPPKDQPAPDTLALLRKWKRQILLWGGPDVVNSYLRWERVLDTSPQTIQTLASMEQLFLALRRELGHNDKKLERHALIGLILSKPEFFKLAYSRDPNMTMQQLLELAKNADKQDT